MRAHAILGNSQRLDGGAMFGNAPRAVWSRWCPPDDLGRIDLACRALLVEEPERGRRVLCETGIGSFFAPKLRERYGVVEDRHVLLESLAAIGVTDADVDFVILSHLHFDHAGGLLAPYAEGAAPRLLFPRAQFIVGRTAWDRARAPHARDRASFIPELPALLEASGRLVIVDGDRVPALGDSWRFRETHGHTPGMLHALAQGPAESMFFCADLIPGEPWVHLPITMGYDRFPEQLIDEKQALYAELAPRGTWLFFTHDPRHAAARIAQDPADGRWRAVDARDVAGMEL